MIRRFLAFQLFYVIGLLRYFMYFLQMEHRVRVMDFITELLVFLQDESVSSRYPMLYRVNNELLIMKHEWSPSLVWETEESEFLFNHLDDFFVEVERFAQDRFGVQMLPSVASALFASQSAVMPALGKVVPFSVALPHDVVAWFEQVKAVRVADHCPSDYKPLANFPSGIMAVRALKSRTIKSLSLSQFNRYTGSGWELNSPLRLH